MAEQKKRRRLNNTMLTPIAKPSDLGQPQSNGNAERAKIFPGSPSDPSTKEDQTRWKGFCEIESEPAFFNVMLREFGVKGYKVQEVLGLDEEILAFLPKPIYGLIFLFRYGEDGVESEESSCPPGVWFANQTSHNSCASIALLNIVNNIPGADLGEELQAFKEITKNLSPALRGDQIANFSFVRNVHNSFARKMDMLNTDLNMQNDVDESKSKRKKKKSVYKEEAGFHFIAFVPIEGQVWKLDGLDGQPHNLGEIGGSDWLKLAVPVIEERMGLYENQSIQFALLGLITDPVAELQKSLAGNILSIQKTNERLDVLDVDWREPLASAADGALDPAQLELVDDAVRIGLGQDQIEAATLSATTKERISAGSVPTLIKHRQELLGEQAELRSRLKDETFSHVSDKEQANGRRYDYDPVIREWVRMLAENGTLQDLL
ncbi:MAG: hypothetical protein M1837_005570 [Sclerophora amabilis]|nr:MAG: hypothetical protein M1837_005570 [Sclerophora amabilis]